MEAIEINKIRSFTHAICVKNRSRCEYKNGYRTTHAYYASRMADGVYMETNILNIVGLILYAYRMTDYA